jgi:hypothetical protein
MDYKRFLLNEIIYSDDHGVDSHHNVIFNYSKTFKSELDRIKGQSKVASVLLKLTAPVSKDILIETPADYIDIVLDKENYGYISFLKYKYRNDDNPWKSIKRISQKATKAFREFFKPEYIEAELTNNDFEIFFNLMKSQKSENQILEFRGRDILKAYNYTHELVKDFGNSCANFYQKELNGSFPEPKEEWYDIYVKNTDNFGVAVAIENEKIVGRISFQQGPNLVTMGPYVKGRFGTVMNNYYGVGGANGANAIKIKNHLIEKYKANRSGQGFAIKTETRFDRFPPFDSMYVCFEHNILADTYGTEMKNNLRTEQNIVDINWASAYSAMCPKSLVTQRLKEEADTNPPAPIYNDFK